jgi:hypothetical protein
VAGLILKPATLSNEYAKLWNAFQQSAQGVGTSKPYFSAGFNSNAVADPQPVCELSGTFHFTGWPYREKSGAVSTTKVLNIVAAGLDRYSCDKGHLVHSTAQVRYDRLSKRDAPPVTALQLHYDFHRGQGPQHPMFHVQHGPVKFDAKHMKQLRVQPGETTHATEPVHGVRIPTPLIGLPGMLLALAADHWDASRFDGLLAKLKKLRALDFPIHCEEMQNCKNGGTATMHSLHWYGYQS